MKTIRARLLAWLIPPLLALVFLISLFFYYSQSDEITSHYKQHLETIVKAAALMISPDDVASLLADKSEPNLTTNTSYLRLLTRLRELQRAVPVQSLFIVAIEPVKPGDRVVVEVALGPNNPIYEGENPDLAFRQRYLVDTSSEKSGHTDFSESGEEAIYRTKKTLVTPIYTSLATKTPTLTGYAPLLSKEGAVLALVGGDLDLTFFESSLHEALILITIAACIAVGLMILSSILVAMKITSPVHKLNDAALSLAAGDYSESIKVDGPQEIEELASTLNTLRECLIDHIARITDLNMSKEKLWGENECRELLEFYMVQEILDKKAPPYWRGRELHLAKIPSYGLWLDIQQKDHLSQIHLKEASKTGFAGVFALLTHDTPREMTIELDLRTNRITLQNQGLFHPLFWSSQQERFMKETEPFLPNDYLILYNSGAKKEWPNSQSLQDWFLKILHHFAKDGFDLTSNMIASELKFLAKKNFHHDDLRFILLQRTGVHFS